MSKKTAKSSKKKISNFKNTYVKRKKYYGCEMQNNNKNELIPMEIKKIEKDEEKGIL